MASRSSRGKGRAMKDLLVCPGGMVGGTGVSWRDGGGHWGVLEGWWGGTGVSGMIGWVLHYSALLQCSYHQ